MKHASAFGLITVLLAAIVGAAYADPEWAADLGVDYWNLPELQSQLDETRRTREDLEQRSQATLQRMAQKQAVIAELINGDISLADAASQFKRLNRGTATERTLRSHYSRWSYDEACCRNVIEMTLGAKELADREAMARRLASELDSLRAQCHGQVRLPD